MNQRLQGRAQVRHGRMSRKAKRGIVRESGRVRLASSPTIVDSVSVTKRGNVIETNCIRSESGDLIARFHQRVTQDGLADKMREVIGGNRHADTTGALGTVETEYFAARSFLQVRLLPDDKGRLGGARDRLLTMADKFGFSCRAADGPTTVEDLDQNTVEIRLKAIPTEDCAMRRELLVAGFRQAQTQERLFAIRRSPKAIVWAVRFCERHSGEWFTLSRVPQRSVDCLFRASWCELLERSRQLPGNGTTEHLRTAHPFRKPKARSKSDLCDGKLTDAELPRKAGRCGITAAEVVASRRNGNGVKYIPRMHRAGRPYVASSNTMRQNAGHLAGENLTTSVRPSRIDGKSLYIG